MASFYQERGRCKSSKILGQEFEISTPALVVFLVGSAIFVLPVFLPRLQNTIGAPGSNSPIARIFSGALSEEKEPNDSFSSANPITIGTTVKGRIAVKDDRDFFVFRTSFKPEGGGLEVSLAAQIIQPHRAYFHRVVDTLWRKFLV